MNNELTEKIKEHIKGKLGEKATAVSFAVMHNGVLETEGALGTIDGNKDNPATPGDLYNVGSVSKVYCAAAIMILVDQKKIKLDDPVCKYLPRFKMPDPRYKDITVRMTLCHTSGLPGTHFKNSFASAWIDGYYDEFYDYLAHSYLKANPGEFSVYCNDGFTLAELLVAEVSGMGYSDFIRKYICDPIGAASTCYSDKLAEGHRHIEMPGKGIEYLTVMGAGGVNTDMYDCAKFAYVFISDSPVLTKESKKEMAKPHGVTFVGSEKLLAHGFGLGWDTVALTHNKYDFGTDVLGKGGTTLQFSSFMMAVPKYGITAACSASIDCGLATADLLSDAIAMTLETKGIDVKKEKHESQPSRIPVEHFEKYAGKYIDHSSLTEVSFSDTEMLVNIYTLTGERIKGVIPPMKYVDGAYVSALGMGAGFAEAKGNTYLAITNRTGFPDAPACMKIGSKYPAADAAWLARVGKKYIACNLDSRDLGAFAFATAFEIKTADFAPGIMFLSCKTDKTLVPICDMPFITQDANTGKQFLDAPVLGSRDTFAPLAFVRDGTEFIYCCGAEYMDAKAAKPLVSGDIVLKGKDNNLIFSFEKDVKPVVEFPDGGCYLILNENAEPSYDSRYGGEPKPYKGGFLVLIGKDGDVFKIKRG